MDIECTYNLDYCENRCVFEKEKKFILDIDKGIKIINSHWNSNNHIGAYIVFRFDDKIFRKVYNKLIGYSVYFSKDINDFIHIDNSLELLKDVKRLPTKEMNSLLQVIYKDNTIFLTKKINYELRIDKQILTDELLQKIIDKLDSKNTKIIAYSMFLLSNDEYYDIVIESGLETLKTDIDKEFENELGKENSITPLYWRFFLEDNITRYKFFIERILNKLTLSYTKNRSIDAETKHIPYEQYMDEKEGLKVYIDGYILDSPWQQKQEYKDKQK